MQIVLARLEEDQVIVAEGRIDLGQRHKFKAVHKPVACMWLNKGNGQDVQSARTFAAREGYTVFCYTGERDPLTRAKKDIAT